jgi:hypothetical protein
MLNKTIETETRTVFIESTAAVNRRLIRERIQLFVFFLAARYNTSP